MFSKKTDVPVLSRRESLTAIPVVNNGVQPERNDRDCVVLHVQVHRGTGLLARFQPPVMEKVVELDELGGFVFELIDGKRAVIEIVNGFEKKYRLNRREAELSVAKFLRSLAERQIISLVIKK